MFLQSFAFNIQGMYIHTNVGFTVLCASAN